MHRLYTIYGERGIPFLVCAVGLSRTFPVSCGPQRQTPGLAPKACAVGRQLQWVVRCGGWVHAPMSWTVPLPR
jgi:hypothetical protein